MKLEERLTALRKKKGLSQLELAETLGVSRQAVSRWEVGASAPGMENLLALSRLYGVPLDELVGGPAREAEPEAEPNARAAELVCARRLNRRWPPRWLPSCWRRPCWLGCTGAGTARPPQTERRKGFPS